MPITFSISVFMTHNATIILWQEGKDFVAQCLNNFVSSFGNTKQEAIQNLNEALELYYEEENEKPTFYQIKKPEIHTSSFSYAQ